MRVSYILEVNKQIETRKYDEISPLELARLKTLVVVVVVVVINKIETQNSTHLGPKPTGIGPGLPSSKPVT